jgi:hypothetical protein
MNRVHSNKSFGSTNNFRTTDSCSHGAPWHAIALATAAVAVRR